MTELSASEKRVGAIVGISGVGTFVFLLGKVFSAKSSGLPNALLIFNGPVLGFLICSIAAYISPRTSWRWGLLFSALYLAWGGLTLLSAFGKEGPKAAILWGSLAIAVTAFACAGGFTGRRILEWRTGKKSVD